MLVQFVNFFLLGVFKNLSGYYIRLLFATCVRFVDRSPLSTSASVGLTTTACWSLNILTALVSCSIPSLCL